MPAESSRESAVTFNVSALRTKEHGMLFVDMCCIDMQLESQEGIL